MDDVTKVLLAIVGVGMVTTAILPNRQTAKVIDAVRKLFTGSLATAMASGVKA
jgi:hypothetical protein